MQKLGLEEPKPTNLSLQLADRSITYPRRIVEDVLVKVDKFIFPVDFIALDMKEDHEDPLILGRPFLATERAMIDVLQGNLILRINDEHVIFNVFKSVKYSSSADTCFKIDVIDQFVDEKFQECSLEDSLEGCITQSKDITVEKNELKEQVMYLEANLPYPYSKRMMVEALMDHMPQS